MTRVQLHVMFVLQNVMMKLLKMRKKKREPPNVIKSTIICDVGTAQYEDGIVKCKKKKENHQM